MISINGTYLCGGINSLSDHECKTWRDYAKILLRSDTIDPMRRDYRGNEMNNYVTIVEDDINDISNVRFVLVNATRPSWGTAMEIVYAYKLCKYIVCFGCDTTSVSPWLKYHCKHIFQTLEEAVKHINEVL